MTEEHGVMAVGDGLELWTTLWLPQGQPIGRVVLVHGRSEHAARYPELAERLVGEGLAVFGFDQRGHGRSPGRRGVLDSFDFLVSDLAVAVTTAEGLVPGPTPTFLFGHSMGGLEVLRYLQSKPARVRAAVLCAPWLGTVVEVPLPLRLVEPVLRVFAPRLAVSHPLQPELLTSDVEKQRERLEDPLMGHEISAGYVQQVGIAQRAALDADIPVDLPLLVLTPTDDRITDQALVQRYFSSLPGKIEVVRLEGFRHEPLNDIGRESVVERITDFFRGHAVPEPAAADRVST